MYSHQASSYSDPALFPPVCYSAGQPNTNTTPHGFFDNSNNPFLSPPTASSSPSYSSSLPSSYLHRSSSTHSLQKHIHQPPFFSSPHQDHHHHPPPPASPSSSSCDFFDFHAGPVRRVFSAGDLQGLNGMQPMGENSSQDGGNGIITGRVGRYSAEERKERIERYRSKRNHRNFHKKITYACRKTLADSRPRVRGRFARNGEPEMETEVAENQDDHISYRDHDHSRGNYGLIHGWRQTQIQTAATTVTEDEEECFYDDDLWTNFIDILSMNVLS